MPLNPTLQKKYLYNFTFIKIIINFTSINYFRVLCVCMYECVYTCMKGIYVGISASLMCPCIPTQKIYYLLGAACMKRSEDSLLESVLSSLHVVSWDQTQVFRLSSKRLTHCAPGSPFYFYRHILPHTHQCHFLDTSRFLFSFPSCFFLIPNPEFLWNSCFFFSWNLLILRVSPFSKLVTKFPLYSPDKCPVGVGEPTFIP